MKKLFVPAFAAVMLFAVACSSNKTEETHDAAATEQTAPAAEQTATTDSAAAQQAAPAEHAEQPQH